MERDFKLIRAKLKEVRRINTTSPAEYRLKMDLLNHWNFEYRKLEISSREDILLRTRLMEGMLPKLKEV